MTISELKNNIRRSIDSKYINWIETENYIQQLGVNINNIVDEEDTILSELYGDVHNGRDAVKLTELFLHHGYDVLANNGFNGAACLHRLCWSFCDHYILHVAELLIDAGADCSIDIDRDFDEEPKGVLASIAWRFGDWMTGEFNRANIFEAYYEMVARKMQNKPYRGIRSFRDSVGKTVHKILRLSWEDSDCVKFSKNAFDGGLVFIADDVALVAKPYVEYVVNPYYLNEDYTVEEDVSEFYEKIIGAKIKGLRFESNSFATINFDNGISLSFMSAYYDTEKKYKTGLGYLRNTDEVLQLKSEMIIDKFLFTNGWSFSDECRVYHLGEVFISLSGKFYHIYSKGVNFDSHTLKIKEVPSEWVERLKRTIRYKNVTIEKVKYVQDSLKWIEIKTQDNYLYICIDTFEKIKLYCSRVRIENPLTCGEYTFDRSLERIEFIN